MFFTLNCNQVTFFSPILFQQYIVLTFFIHEPNFMQKKIPREIFFPFLVAKSWCRKISDGLFFPPFLNRTSDFRCFCSVWVFWSTLPVTLISRQTSFRKMCFWCRIHMDPHPNGCTENLDHLRVNLMGYFEYNRRNIIYFKLLQQTFSYLYRFFKSSPKFSQQMFQVARH